MKSMIKLILIVIAAILALYFGFAILGFAFTALWYLFWIGLLGLAGYGGYKLLFAKEGKGELRSMDASFEIDDPSARLSRELKEIEQRYLK